VSFMRGKWHGTHGSEKVVFRFRLAATRHAETVKAARELSLSQEQLSGILYENAKRYFVIGGVGQSFCSYESTRSCPIPIACLPSKNERAASSTSGGASLRQDRGRNRQVREADGVAVVERAMQS